MTLQEFFAYKGKIVIHCPEYTQAKLLLSEFDALGKTWVNKQRYITYDNWEDYGDETCYTNDGHYSGLSYFRSEGYTIILSDAIDIMPNDTQLTTDGLLSKFNELMNL